ncbi:MAG: M16 family metallopeptidase [Oligoflexus sp.]
MKNLWNLGLAVVLTLQFACQNTSSKQVAADFNPDTVKELSSVEGITEYQLPNGLKVLLFPDPSKSTVTVNMTYFVGSRHEGYGEAGMAHLLEHMVFKGTPERPDIWKALQNRGAQFNGTTWTDRTNYYETLPASQENLEFAIGLEADRMVNSVIADEDLQKEFSVVRNEFEMQENNPARVLLQRLHSAAYLWHNYGKSTIGNRSDIERVPVENLRAFYRRYYQPDNAMLVVSGRFDQAEALQLIEKNFADIPAPERKLPETYTQEPVQDGERFVVMRRTGDVPVAGLLYHIVPGSHEEYVAIEAFSHLLLNRPSGRLYQKLVEGGKAANVYGGPFAWRDPGSFWMMAQVAPGQSAENVQKMMIEGIEGIDIDSITEEEVRRFKNQTLSNLRLTMANSQAIAIGLSEWASLGDWRLMFVYRDRVENLQLEDVKKVASRYFVQSNRTAGLFLPTDDLARAPEVDQPDVNSFVDNYKGREGLAEGEVFEATYSNIAKRSEQLSLANGMQLALLPKRTRGETVELIASVRYGSENSLKGMQTAESILPSLMLRGTKNLSYQELQDRMVELDARITAQNSDHGLTSFRITTKKDKLAEVVALLQEIMREPALPKDEFATLKTQTITTLQENLRDPNQLAQNALLRATMPFVKNDLFYVRTIEEQIAAMQTLKLADLQRLHRDFWGAQDMTVAVVGDFEVAEVQEAFQNLFSDWQAKQKFQPVVMPYRQASSGQLVIDTPDKSGAMVAVGHNLQLNIEDERFPALQLASFILGGSSSSRIFDRLRQKEGLAYGAWGRISADTQGNYGRFTAGAICAPENAKRAMTYLMEEIERLRNEGVAAEELQRSRSSFIEVTRNQLANDRYLVSLLDQSLRETRKILFFQDIQDKILALSAEELNQAIRDGLQPGAVFQVIAADQSPAQQASSH